MGACAALLLLAPVTALAKTIQIEAAGTVAFGTDTLGVFGTPGANLAGQTFTGGMTFDLTNAGYFNFGFRTDLYGGDTYDFLPNFPASLGNAEVTVGGVHKDITANYNTTLTAFSGGFDLQEAQERNLVFIQELLFVENPGFGVFTPDYQPPAGNLCALSDCSGSHFNYQLVQTGSQTFLQLNLTSLTISEVKAGAPEPASWALMIGGFGLAGAALRRRRGAVA